MRMDTITMFIYSIAIVCIIASIKYFYIVLPAFFILRWLIITFGDNSDKSKK